VQLIAVISIPVAFVVMAAVEWRWPGRGWPRDRRWLARGGGWLVIAGLGLALVPAVVAGEVGSPLALDRRIGLVPGALVGFVVGDLIGYVTHRLRHTATALWRWHQLHHSAERVDVAGTGFVHPLDLAVDVAGLAAAAIALGLSVDATVLAGLVTWLAAMFQHLDVSTPQWVGWVVQRPEAHAIHHARGVHAYNYGKLMIWDIVLGTFRNPASFSSEAVGFWDGASHQLGRMLAGRDVGDGRELR